MTQKTFAVLNWELKQKKTRRERFLEEMAVAVPWKELEKLVKPVAPRSEPGELGGRPGYRVAVMLRIYFCQTWYNLFGMKCHVGVDATSGVIHTALCSHAKVPDVEMLPALLHGEEKEVIGDRGYCSESDREELNEKGVKLLTPQKKPVGGVLTEEERERNKRLSARRAIGEHPFHVIKNIFRYTKVRYRGLMKNSCHLTTLCMLASLYLKRKVLAQA